MKNQKWEILFIVIIPLVAAIIACLLPLIIGIVRAFRR
jgi:hypothetical protein